ncbi:hypothetical protein XENTR_v10022100 [Xenopus tropicalis]|nr:hypothetical protein XENTR_v10022100 [Xenopus tropicalis]
MGQLKSPPNTTARVVANWARRVWSSSKRSPFSGEAYTLISLTGSPAQEPSTTSKRPQTSSSTESTVKRLPLIRMATPADLQLLPPDQ